MMRTHFRTFFLAVLALAICTGTLQATISTNPNITAITLNCDAVSGLAPVQYVGIQASAANTSVSVAMTPVAPATTAQGIVATQADGKTALVGNAQTVGTTAVNFGFHLGQACKGATNGSQVSLVFSASGATNVTVTATIALTSTAGTSLTASTNAVTLTCIRGTGAGTGPGPNQSIYISSSMAGGTGFYVDNTVPIPGSMTVVSPAALGSANWNTVNPGPFTVTLAPAACTAATAGTSQYNLTLANPPAKALVIPVTIIVAPAANPIVPTWNTVATTANTVIPLNYTQGTAASGSTTTTNFKLTTSSASSIVFSVNTSLLPSWLSVGTPSGTISSGTSPVTELLSVTDGAITLPSGIYSAVLHIMVAGYADTTVNVSLNVSPSSTALAIEESAQAETQNWTIGNPYPTFTVTALASGSAQAYTASVAACTTSVGSCANSDSNGIPLPNLNPGKGLATVFGTPITVSFVPGALSTLSPGKKPMWTVTLTPNTGSPVSVVLTLNVLSPGARITSISPASLPLNPTPGTSYTVTVTGSGFVAGSPQNMTNVGVYTGGFIWPDTNITNVTVLSPSSLNFTVTVPSLTTPDQYFNWAAGGAVNIGVCNPNGSTCNTPLIATASAPPGYISLSIGGAPVISAVTSASTFVLTPAGAYTTVAPYDIISLFGSSFCNACGNNAVTGVLSSGALQYQSLLSPDNGTHTVSVQFYSHSNSPTLIGTAPLLYITNYQINLLVPDNVWNVLYQGKLVDIVVNSGLAASMVAGNKYPVLVAQTDPGVFTIGGDGQGDAAALDITQSSQLITTSGSPLAAAINVASSDMIELFVTGLGEPDASNSFGASWGGQTCMAPSEYITALQAAIPTATPVFSDATAADGLVMQSAINSTTTSFTPCFKNVLASTPTVTVGGVAATVNYAGWVPDSVAGLYQINATLPSGTGTTSAFTTGTPYTSNFKNATGQAVSLATMLAGTTLPVVVSFGGNSSQAGVNLNVIVALKVTATPSSFSLTAGANSATALTTVTANGSGSYTFADTNTALPGLGLSLNTGTGVITAAGAVTTNGSAVPVAIGVTDNKTGATGSVTVNITVN